MKNTNNNVKGRAYYQGLRSKYLNSAKEASSSGDKILCEYNLQFAEHYTRLIAERFPQQPAVQQSASKPEAQKSEATEETNSDSECVLVQETIEQPETDESAEKPQEEPTVRHVTPRKRVVRRKSPAKSVTNKDAEKTQPE